MPRSQSSSTRQTVFFTSVGPMNKEHNDRDVINFDAPHLAWCKYRKCGRNIKTRCTGLTSNLLKRFLFYQIRSNAVILYDAPSLLQLEVYHDVIWRIHLRESFCVTSTSSEDFISKTIGWKNWVQKLLEVWYRLPINQTKNPIVRRRDLLKSKQPSHSSAQEIDTRVLLRCESTSLSVERWERDKDTDENVGADQVRTGRPVGSEQSIGLFTQPEEIDIDFRVSGLPHAVVKQAETLAFANSWRRSRVILIDKHFKPIFNKITLAAHSVKNQKWWFVKWAM